MNFNFNFRNITVKVLFSLFIALAIFSASCSSNGPIPAVKTENSGKRLDRIDALRKHRYDIAPSYYEGIDEIVYDKFGRIQGYRYKFETLQDGESAHIYFTYEYKADSIIVYKSDERRYYYIVNDGLIIESGGFPYTTTHGRKVEGGIACNIRYDSLRLVSVVRPGSNSNKKLTWNSGNVVKVTDDDRHDDYFYTEQPCKTPMIYCVFFETCSSPYNEILPFDEGSGLFLAQCGFFGEPLTKNIISHSTYSGRPNEKFGDKYKYEFDSDGYVTRKYWTDSSCDTIDISYTWR